MATILHQTVPQKRYISTTTVISAGENTTVRRRELIGRVMSESEMLPYGRIVEFTNVDAVRDYFGIENTGEDKPEVEFAKKYFGIVGNSGFSPEKISYARWCPKETKAYVMPRIVEKNPQTFVFCENTNIVFTYQLEDGLETYKNAVPFDLSSVTSVVPYSGMVSLVEALNAGFAAQSGILAGCVASYTDGHFKIEFPEEIKYVYACSKVYQENSSGQELASFADMIGLTEEKGVICSDYAAGEDEAGALTRVINISDNFGSFCFFDPDLDDPEKIAERGKLIMGWLSGRKYDMLAVQRVRYTETGSGLSEITKFGDKVKTRKGFQLVVGNTALGYCQEEALPMAILASTHYDDDDANANVNWMFVSAPDMTSTVTMDNWATNLDSLCVNYLGETQAVAQKRNFYQKGINYDGELASVYCAEMWLRDRIGASIMAGFLGSEVVRSGDVAQVTNWIKSVLDVAARNGTFSKPEQDIEPATQLIINNYFGGVKTAWEELQKDGYGCQVGSQKVEGGWKVGYRLAYYHHSQIFKLEGIHFVKGV